MVHYSLHNCWQMVPILGKINLDHILQSCFLKINFVNIPSTNTSLAISGFPVPLPCMLHDLLCTSHSSFDHPNYIWWGSQIIKYSPAQPYFLFLRSKYSTHHPVLRHPETVLPLRGPVSCPYKITDKVIVSCTSIFFFCKKKGFLTQLTFWTSSFFFQALNWKVQAIPKFNLLISSWMQFWLSFIHNFFLPR